MIWIYTVVTTIAICHQRWRHALWECYCCICFWLPWGRHSTTATLNNFDHNKFVAVRSRGHTRPICLIFLPAGRTKWWRKRKVRKTVKQVIQYCAFNSTTIYSGLTKLLKVSQFFRFPIRSKSITIPFIFLFRMNEWEKSKPNWSSHVNIYA